LLIIQDQKGWVFGGLANETWRKWSSFYGNGENMLFSFRNTNNLEAYKWTGISD
jgi:hypothetical protein